MNTRTKNLEMHSDPNFPIFTTRRSFLVPEVQLGGTFANVRHRSVGRRAVETVVPFLPAKGPREHRLEAGHQVEERQGHEGAVISDDGEDRHSDAVTDT